MLYSSNLILNIKKKGGAYIVYIKLVVFYPTADDAKREG